MQNDEDIIKKCGRLIDRSMIAVLSTINEHKIRTQELY